MNISACVFIRDNNVGAFCLYESMASLLPFVDEYIVMDLGSTDGTYQILQSLAQHNRKIKIAIGRFEVIDAGVFATLANDLVRLCSNDTILYHQADEVWHPDLLRRMEQELNDGKHDLAFWRIQYRDNFQKVKWFPHLVHRVGKRDNFTFTGDGMTTNRTWDARICSQYGGEYFPKWGEMGQDGIKPFVDEMIMDVSLVGGFRDNIVQRRALHAPFWHEEPTIEGKPAEQWKQEAMLNDDWIKTTSPYNLPPIMRYHIGKTQYQIRRELLDAIQRDDTREMVGL